jgi:uridine kinase
MPDASDVVLGHLSGAILGRDKTRPVLVGIDGVDAAGKTTFADRLADKLRESKRQIIRASIDGFHNPRSVRYTKGRNSPEGYYRDSFNYRLLDDCLLEPLLSEASEYKEIAFDYRTDRQVDVPSRSADRDAILVMDGIFLFRPELAKYWDIKIFLEVSFDVTVNRATKRAREQGALDSDQDIRDVYDRRYIPGQRLYFEEAFPRDRADVVIDNNDFNSPVILRTSFR